jgi:DNA-directed RNA polymerase specialized sigma24 family protein
MVPLKLTLDQASFLYERLCRIMRHTPNPSRHLPGVYFKLTRPLGEGSLEVRSALSDPAYLFEILSKHLKQLQTTTPVSVSSRNVLRFHDRTLVLRLRRNERAFLLRILNNKQADAWREEAKDEKLFSPLQAADEAEEEGGRESFYSPSHPEHPGAVLRQTMIRKALAELPKKLGISAEEVSALFAALTEGEGNVSEAARRLGQPQRKTARRIERIIRHLKSRNLAA